MSKTKVQGLKNLQRNRRMKLTTASINSRAHFSECGRFRYTLEREFLYGGGTLNFIMLNPSTADEYHTTLNSTVRASLSTPLAFPLVAHPNFGFAVLIPKKVDFLMSKTSIESAYPVYDIRQDFEDFSVVLQWVNPGDEIDPVRFGHPCGHYSNSERAIRFALEKLRLEAGELPAWARQAERL